MSLKERIKQNPVWKQRLLHAMMHPVKSRPRRWLRWLQPLYMQRGRGSVIYRSVRRDIVPFNAFHLGAGSVVEDFCTINNAVGDVWIGDRSRVGLGNTVIGPVKIGNDVNLAQNITVSGLNHNFTEVDRPIAQQGVSTAPVVIDDDVWIGAGAVILSGVQIGQHSVVAAGSIVTHDVPPRCVVAGNPARPIKRYDQTKKAWLRCDNMQ